MVKNQIKYRRHSSLFPRMDSVTRISGIPVVETGMKSVENVYCRFKNSNRLFNWGLETAESTVYAAMETARPLINLMEGPILKIDEIFCKSLDVIEQRVPSMYLPPQLMYWNTKEYMSDHLVKPVLTRANSVKKIGNIVLDSKVTNFAAGRLDTAFVRADAYIEKYLPNCEDTVDYTCDQEEDKNSKHAMQTIHRGHQVTRKLKRRLTMRTIAEAKALKQQSKEAIHILVYAAELIVTDPKEALVKSRELWNYLSQDEPENQASPHSLEELIVMLTRESARRVIHLINFTVKYASRLPKSVRNTTHEMTIHFLYATNSLIKITHLDEAKVAAIQEAAVVRSKLSIIYNEIQDYTSNALARLAIFLSGRLEAEKITANPRRRIYTIENDNSIHNSINGVY